MYILQFFTIICLEDYVCQDSFLEVEVEEGESFRQFLFMLYLLVHVQ